MSLKEKLPGIFGSKNLKDFKNVIVSVDTNILLSLLTMNQKAFEDLYNIFKELNDNNQLFLTHHVAEEFAIDSDDVCRKDGKIYSEIDNKIKKVFNLDAALKNDYKDRVKDYKKISEEIEKVKTKFTDFFKKELVKIDYEKRGNLIEQLFKNVGKPYDKNKLYEVYKEIEFRYSAFIPPGFKDKTKDNGNKYGDCLIWFQLMDYAKEVKKNIVYVISDVKEDWVKDGKFRKELYNEFYNETSQQIFMFEPTDFVNKYHQLTGTKTKNVKPAQDYTALIQEFINSRDSEAISIALDKIRPYDIMPIPKYTGEIIPDWNVENLIPHYKIQTRPVFFRDSDYMNRLNDLIYVPGQFDFTYSISDKSENSGNEKKKKEDDDSSKNKKS